jgi:hypothetical protein
MDAENLLYAFKAVLRTKIALANERAKLMPFVCEFKQLCLILDGGFVVAVFMCDVPLEKAPTVSEVAVGPGSPGGAVHRRTA